MSEHSRTLTLASPLKWQVLPDGAVQNPADFSLPERAQAFRILAPHTDLPTQTGNEVWLRFALPASASPETWILRIPRLSVERVALYFQDADNQWFSVVAGDSVAMNQWPENTRTPSFQLQTRTSGERVYFVKLNHRKAITERPELITPNDYIDGAQQVGILIGLTYGLLGLMTLLALITARMYRNMQFAWFGLMVFALMCTHLVLIGYASHRLWPDSIWLNRTIPVVLPMWALAATTWFVTQVGYARSAAPRMFKLSLVWMVVLVGLSLAFAADPVQFPRDVLALVVMAVMLWNLGALVWLALRAQSWLWLVAAGFAPITLSMMVRVAYTMGLLSHMEIADFVGVVTGCVGMITVYISMLLHNREAYAALEREAALERTDGSTGLTQGRIAMVRLPQVLLRSQRFGKPCGVVMVRWLGYQAQLEAMSSGQRGAVLAHFGARLRRLARDIDTVARYDDEHFIFLLESPVSREALSDLGMKILTTCMRPSAHLGGGEVYNVHVSIALVNGNAMPANDVTEALRTRLSQMDPQTPRRMQFVDSPLSTRPGSESDELNTQLSSQEIVDKINRLEAITLLPTVAPTAAPAPSPLDMMTGRVPKSGK